MNELDLKTCFIGSQHLTQRQIIHLTILFFFANNQIQRFDLAAFHHNNKRNIEQIDAHEMQQPQL